MKRISNGHGFLKLIVWSILFLTVTSIVWHREVFRLFDNFFGTSVSPVIEERLKEPLTVPLEPPQKRNDFVLSDEDEYDRVAVPSDAAKADILRNTVPSQPAVTMPVTMAVTMPVTMPQNRYSDQYIVPAGEPEMITRGAALNRKEIPSLAIIDGSGFVPPSVPAEPETVLPKIRNRSKLDNMAPMIALSGGMFRMGNDTAAERDQKPSHVVRLEPFRMDCHEVTNRQFQLFVQETKYRTTAEQCGWSYVFDFERKVWVRMVGVCWWNPSGKNPHGGAENAAVNAMYDFPVVHITWEDAQAFCCWSGKRLPSEAEWEYAAKGGFVDSLYPWGSRRQIDGNFAANYWQGWYPDENSVADGFLLQSPVGSFPANRYGFWDLGGNVWEWCGDRYRADYYRRSPLDNPLGPSPEEGETVSITLFRVRRENGRYVEEEYEDTKDIPYRVVRGGSFLSAENGDAGYRTAARGYLPQSLSFSDVGFRCAE
ncbi:MAG: formylglycine-generating enzyme family protein [Planctomycetaceae bacterium]|jgi:formylglycine-generating enzyme required for sulfatase activity|nr:formylglycine-generating enzyme family protein [Planctomycetaceae bacterium]